jgi:superfamily II DNA/RNA helicase
MVQTDRGAIEDMNNRAVHFTNRVGRLARAGTPSRREGDRSLRTGPGTGGDVPTVTMFSAGRSITLVVTNYNHAVCVDASEERRRNGGPHGSRPLFPPSTPPEGFVRVGVIVS